MTQDDAAGDSGSAEDIYGEFLQRRREGEDVDLEQYCEEHPRLAHAGRVDARDCGVQAVESAVSHRDQLPRRRRVTLPT